MNISSVDNNQVRINNEGKLLSEITNLSLKGPNLEIEGYATIEGLKSFSEHHTRKMLLILPKINMKEYRQKNPEKEEETDEEILHSLSMQVPLDNCLLTDILVPEKELMEYESSLSGFKGSVDLSKINNEKPLRADEYNVFVTLEQMDDENDAVKYEKIIPISNAQKFMGNDILTTRLDYFSTKEVLKYNLIASFDKFSKTLRLKNTVLQSYDPRKLDEEDVTTENRYLKGIKNRLFKLCYMLFCFFPIDKNKIVFASDSRTELNGNFFFVYEELLKRNLNLEIKFVFNESVNHKRSFRETIGMAYQIATAKIILLDDFYPKIYPLNIRKGADLIQVWHAAGAFKTFGFSRLGRPGGPSPYSKNHKNYTKAAVSSEGVRGNYAEGFGITEEKVYATGVPRSDIFFDEDYKGYVKERLHEKYPILREKKVILFAPTFRGNGQSSAHYSYENLNLKELYENLSDEYVFLMKIHPFVKNKITIPYEYADFFIDFSEYREINDLLLVTDILITDYSSVCFEFALLNKPMLFFAYDVNEYIESRDFYYNYFDFVPGPIVKTTEQIIETIKKEDFQLEKIPNFVKYFFDDTLGKASKNVVDQLIIPSLNDEYLEENDEKVELPPAKSRRELFDRTLENEDEDL